MLRRFPPARAILTASLLLSVMGASAALTSGKLVPEEGQGGARILVLDGSPVHDVGEVRVHASNWGAIGSRPGSSMPFASAPSAEWPAGSSVEYLWEGGLWVGAILNGVPVVSTCSYTYEFRPSSDLRDIVYRTSLGAVGGNRIPSAAVDDDADGEIDEDWLDGWDNDGDLQVDEDFAGISDQMFVRRFRDDDISAIQAYPDHEPMGLFVREESYQWADDDYDDFVGFTFRITNDGTEVLEHVYVGVFADPDVGHRSTPNYWTDDGAYFQAVPVDHTPHGMQTYDFGYWYDLNGDGGQADRYGGVVILDHPTDPTGVTAPSEVGAYTVMNMVGAASFEDGGQATNDFERYEAMSMGYFDPPASGDVSVLVSVGEFDQLAPGETIEFSFALVVTPRDDFTNVERAARAYHGLWFNLDGDPGTGVQGREHQEHWYLPNEDPTPVAITAFDARAVDDGVRLEWSTWADEDIAGFELLRATGEGEPIPLAGRIPGDRRAYMDETVTPGARYEYQLVAHGVSGWEAISPRVGVTVPPITLALRQNAPNPFQSSTTITFTVPERTRVDLAVFDAAGRRVATVLAGERPGGTHEVVWDGTNDAGQRVGAGVYFCRLEAGGRTVTRKLSLLQ